MKRTVVSGEPGTLIYHDRLVQIAFGVTGLIAALLLLPILSHEHLFRFSEYYSDLAGLLLSVVALQYRLNRVRHLEARRFWNLWTLATILWMAARGIHIVYGNHQWNQYFDLLTDAIYVAVYLSVFLALGNRPYIESGWTIDNRLHRVDSTGRVLFAFGLLVYFVLIPSQTSASASGAREPSFFLFAILDLALLINIAFHRWLCDIPRWKFVYSVFFAVTCLWTFNDVLEGFAHLGVIASPPEASFLDLLWHLGWICQFPLIILMARSREAGHFPSLNEEQRSNDLERFLPKLRHSALILFAFAFPCIHFLSYQTGLLDPSLRTQREICTLIFLVVGAVTALIYQNLLEKAGRKSVWLYSDLFENAPVMYVITIDSEISPIIVDCNKLFLSTLGYQRENAVGTPLTDFCDPETVSILPEVLARGAGNDQPAHELVLIDRRGKRIPTLVQAGSTQRQNEPCLRTRVTFIDISKRKHLEEQLQQAQKMEAVGQLAGGVAHDFNNLLTVINGNAEMLLQTLPAGDPRCSDVEEIEKAGERATALTRQLLAFSRRQDLQPRIVQLNDVVSDMERLLRRVIGEDIRLIQDCAEQLSPIEADPGQLEQVIVNLVVNARDAMPYGGNLFLQTRNVSSNGFQLKQNGKVHSGPCVQLVVSDSGHGMNKETIDRIFEPFFTTKGTGKGTGLGLATVYGIVKQSGGVIEVESRPGAGTTFSILFPAVESDESSENKAGSVVQQLETRLSS